MEDELLDLNLQIINAENRGGAAESTAFFERILSPVFAFRRASGAVVDRAGYLDALQSGGDRAAVGDSTVSILGSDRAFVTCTVRVTVEGRPMDFENARLFVRDGTGQWQLLAWANEASTVSPSR